jgi:dipeptidyl aminopeptidase/acylaminoacyl peptidase
MNPDGTNVHQLARFAPGPTCIDSSGMAWSPDGARIAFSLNSGARPLLEVMNADGTNVHPLGANTVGDEPGWSPDSSQIVFRNNNGLGIISADGSGPHQVTIGPDEHPSWSPDGKTIVFASDRDDPYTSVHYPREALELYLVAPDGSNLRPLTFTKPSTFEDEATFRTTDGKRLGPLPGLPVLAGEIAAIGSVSGGVDRITLYNRSTAAQLAQVSVGTAKGSFSVAGADTHWVVFHRGTTISALNLSTHHNVILATAAANPLDLSVSGQQVAWAENIYGHGRIRALELPS